MRFIVLLFSMVLTQLLEVEGDLKVTGNIDASNQRIKNVAPPTMTTDAVNAEYLNSVMTDDSVYEFTYYSVLFMNAFDGGGGNSPFFTYYKSLGDMTFSSNWEDYIDQLIQEGWKVSNIMPGNNNSYDVKVVYELRRKLED